MSKLQETVTTYGAAWQEEHPEWRLKLLTTALNEKGRYTDPTADLVGPKALCDHIGVFQVGNPGAKIEVTSTATLHHDIAHFTWRMLLPDGQVRLTGHDFAEFDEDGKILRLAGFFGDPDPL